MKAEDDFIGLLINFGGERLEFKKKFRQAKPKLPVELPNSSDKITKIKYDLKTGAAVRNYS